MKMIKSFSMTMLLVTVISSISMVSSASSPEAEFVQKTISSHKIVIFSKSYCPYAVRSLKIYDYESLVGCMYCKRAKSVFRELDQVSHVVELDQREDGWSIQSALGEIVGRQHHLYDVHV